MWHASGDAEALKELDERLTKCEADLVLVLTTEIRI